MTSRFFQRLGDHNSSTLAAAVAFYSFLSIFPALAAVVSLYGLVASPSDISRQLDSLRAVLPEDVLSPLSTWLTNLVNKPRGHFGLGLTVSVLISVWSARYATATLMTALDIAFAVPEQRSFLRYNAVALLLTLLLIVFVGTVLILVGLIPVLVGYLPIDAVWKSRAMWLRWPILLAFVAAAVAFLYRWAPNRSEAKWELTSAGATVAIAGLIAGSYGFSVYVSSFASYDKTYGSLGAVAVMLTWLWIAAYSILVGAELNAEIAKMRSHN
ncbi:Ribonuclease BN (fragment) [Bradyrhizobium sp. ORS 375]